MANAKSGLWSSGIQHTTDSRFKKPECKQASIETVFESYGTGSREHHKRRISFVGDEDMLDGIRHAIRETIRCDGKPISFFILFQ